jgi:hypothetical protein
VRRRHGSCSSLLSTASAGAATAAPRRFVARGGRAQLIGRSVRRILGSSDSQHRLRLSRVQRFLIPRFVACRARDSFLVLIARSRRRWRRPLAFEANAVSYAHRFPVARPKPRIGIHRARGEVLSASPYRPCAQGHFYAFGASYCWLPPNYPMQLANRRFIGPALKRLGQIACDGVTSVAVRFFQRLLSGAATAAPRRCWRARRLAADWEIR